MKKKIFIGIAAFVIIFVVADYCGLFSIIHIDGAFIVPAKFQFVDLKGNFAKDTSITAFLNGYDLGGRFVCDDNDPSFVFGQIGIGAGWERTILFRKPLFSSRRVNKKEIKFLFKHPDYLEQEKTFFVRSLKKELHVIVLQPKEQADEKNN